LLPRHVLAGEGNRLACSKSGDGRLISGTDDDGGSVTHSSDLTTGIDEGLHEIHTPAGVLRYYDTGHDLNGPPLLFLHGSGPGVTGHRNFRGVLPTFSRLSLDRFDIIGNSMGGSVAINLAIQHPQRVRRLVTIGGIGTNLFTPGPSEGIRLLQEFTEDPTRQRLIDWLNCMVYDPALITDELIEERWSLASDPQALQAARRMYSKAAFAKMTAMMAKSDAPLPWATMHKVAAPTLLTWGRDDRVSPLDMAIIPMRTIPNAELHVFPNCGHWAMIEAKEAFESTVLAFLERQ
jgi:pimeloyl-ACP methyl ester carboxylesterase